MKNITTSCKTLLIIGHPGHELRAYGFIKKYKPAVVVLTDGSGSKNHSRLQQTINLVESLGCVFHNSLRVFSDRELYDIVLGKELESLKRYREELFNLIEKEGYTVFIGDALEGFNPTHDICRYLINGIVAELQFKYSNKKFLNYDFVLEGTPDLVSQDSNVTEESLMLTAEEFEMKIAAAKNYPELKYEVERAMDNFGEEFFSCESFGIVTQLQQIKNWDTEIPYYESFGKKRVQEGSYKSIITFDNHIEAIAKLFLMSRNEFN